MGPCKNVNRIIKIKKYRKIPKISPGAYIFQRPFLRGIYVRRGLSTEGGGAHISRGDLTEGFLRYKVGRLIFGGAYFRNFTVH